MEKTGLLIGRLFLALLAGLFIYFGFFANVPCDGIDNVYLGCRMKVTSLWDWIGTIGFLVGLLTIAGAFKFINNSLSAPNSLDKKLFILIAVMVGSIILIWNA